MASANPFDGDRPDPFEKARGRFNRPASSFEKVQEYEGRLLLITPTGFTPQVDTKFGKADAVNADIVVLDGDEAPKELNGLMIFQKVLVGQLKGQIGKQPVLGVLVQKPSQKGHDAWQLDDNVSEAQVDTAIAFLDAKEAAAKKGRISTAAKA